MPSPNKITQIQDDAPKNILLDDNEKFKVMRSSKQHSDTCYVTFRSPANGTQRTDGCETIKTSTIEASEIKNLHVLEEDGLFYVVCDSTKSYCAEIKLNVLDPAMGHELINEFLRVNTRPTKNLREKDTANTDNDSENDSSKAPSVLQNANTFVEEISVLIWTLFGIGLISSACYFLIQYANNAS